MEEKHRTPKRAIEIIPGDRHSVITAYLDDDLKPVSDMAQAAYARFIRFDELANEIESGWIKVRKELRSKGD